MEHDRRGRSGEFRARRLRRLRRTVLLPRRASGLAIGPHTAIGPHCALIAESLGFDPHTPRARQPQAGKPITVRGNVRIGAGAKILGGTSIGDGAIVGAGAVVTKDVPARAVVVDVPARAVRLLD